MCWLLSGGSWFAPLKPWGVPGVPHLRKGLVGRGHGHTQVSPQEADRKTNSSKLSPRWFLYTWFIPSDPHVATPASFALPAWSYPLPPLLGGPLLMGHCLQRWGGEKRGSLSTKWLPCGLSPPETQSINKYAPNIKITFIRAGCPQ